MILSAMFSKIVLIFLGYLYSLGSWFRLAISWLAVLKELECLGIFSPKYCLGFDIVWDYSTPLFLKDFGVGI